MRFSFVCCSLTELKPRVASTLLPGLPAYIFFMCIRHADYINSDEKIRSFLTNVINAIRRLIKKRHEDLDTSVVWLVNTCRLLHSLKQYSGEKVTFRCGDFYIFLKYVTKILPFFITDFPGGQYSQTKRSMSPQL